MSDSRAELAGPLISVFDHAVPPRALRRNGELLALVQSHEAKLLERQLRIDSLMSAHQAESDAHERAVRRQLCLPSSIPMFEYV
jgi:hypothetical protein